MNVARVFHTATLLKNGQVLVVGVEGITDSAQASAELYNPLNGKFTLTGNLTVHRLAHSATLLSNGMVLVAGGADGLSHAVPFDELYNPATGRFTVTGSLNAARLFHTATTLDSGQVLLAGGNNSVAALGNAERFTSLDKFALTASMSTPRTFHSASLLNSGALAGEVLIAGGFNIGPLASAEIFNPVTGIFKTTGSLHLARLVHTSTRLNDGEVLIAGGETNKTIRL
ncbi:MAG: Kelch repeat-containing protein [Candidatus Binataceae bacterium]